MSADGPSAGDRPRTKRMLPSVSDVVRELQVDAPSDPSLLFKVARQVCAEELGRVKLGKEAVALEVLVERARNILDPTREVAARRDDSGAFALDVPTGPIPSHDVGSADPFGSGSYAQVPAPLSAENDDPFNEASAPVDLGWDHDVKDSPLSNPGAAEPILTSYSSAPEPRSPYAPPSRHEPAFAEPTPVHADAARVGREAQGMDLHRDPPRGQKQAAVSSWGQDEDATERVDTASIPSGSRTIFDAPAKKRSSMLPMLMVIGGVVAVLAAAYLVVGRGFLQDTERPTAVLNPKARRTRTRPGENAAGSGPTTSSPATARTPAPVRTRPAIAVLDSEPQQTAASTPVAVAPKNPQPTAKMAQPTSVPALVVATRPSPAPAQPVASAAPSPSKASSRAGALASSDWAGKAPVYVVHFTSYKDRQNAEKDAARLAKEFGKTGHAVAVDLGSKGLWYRAVLGDFDSFEEAQNFRSELASKKTPSLGLVYHLISP
ncbi:MAG: SPOR domain-containing protein [Thermoanaerobaculia bacterium]